jgi:uncharacterized membrane protein YedE/YeeE
MGHMTLIEIMEWLGEPQTAALGGLVIGLMFGAAAQQSRFCLRAAIISFARRRFDTRLSVWLLVFSGALIATQALYVAGVANLDEARQIATQGSLSGALIGGLLFGAGMVLARGCASRLLVLSATGNLRALLSGLVFAVTAQASLHGFLSPMRNWLASLWTIAPENGLNLLATAGGGHVAGVAFGVIWFAAAIWFVMRNKVATRQWLAGLVAGATVAVAWWFTYAMSTQAFEPMPVKSMTFTGPSADTLMMFLTPPGSLIDFDVGLVPGVFLGSFLAALLTRELKLQGFEGAAAMRRYLTGAACMGFGGMLAGGCAVGAGVTGASIFALTAWVALSAMWAAAAITDRLVDSKAETETVSGAEPQTIPSAALRPS